MPTLAIPPRPLTTPVEAPVASRAAIEATAIDHIADLENIAPIVLRLTGRSGEVERANASSESTERPMPRSREN